MTEADISQYKYVAPDISYINPMQKPPTHPKAPRLLSFRGDAPAPTLPNTPIPRDETGIPIGWKMERLRRSSTISNCSDSRDDVSVSNEGDDDDSVVSESPVLKMWRASLKGSSPYKYMQLHDMNQSSTSELETKSKSLRPTLTKIESDLVSIKSETAMSQDENSVLSPRRGVGGEGFNDENVAVAGWLDKSRKALKPTPTKPSRMWHDIDDTNNDDDVSKFDINGFVVLMM